MAMNRVFRGKRIKNGEWIEGYYRYIPCINRHSILPTNPKNEQEEYPITLETVGQYTGLTDKNGKKIFEGDILRGFQYPFCHDGKYNYYAEIIFADCSFMTYTHKNPSSCVRGISDGNTELMECWVSEDWEVIGNIYDNPELLEDKENKHGEDI